MFSNVMAKTLSGMLPLEEVRQIGSSITDPENAKDIDIVCILSDDFSKALGAFQVPAWFIQALQDGKPVDIKIMPRKLAERRGFLKGEHRILYDRNSKG